MKDDLMKMEAISQETRLLCRNRIDTVEQLLSYKGSLETEKPTCFKSARNSIPNPAKRAAKKRKPYGHSFPIYPNA